MGIGVAPCSANYHYDRPCVPGLLQSSTNEPWAPIVLMGRASRGDRRSAFVVDGGVPGVGSNL